MAWANGSSVVDGSAWPSEPAIHRASFALRGGGNPSWAALHEYVGGQGSAPFVFAIGDVAASDPERSSACNSGAVILAHDVRALLEGREVDMKVYTAPRHRRCSIVGPQRDGLRVYSPKGGSVRIPTWFVEKIRFPLVVRRGNYGGVRNRPFEAIGA